MYDIIVVGGGPAGLTAALYARRAEKSVLVLEANSFGGQIIYSDNVENYPGMKSMSGTQFADMLLDQVLEAGAEVDLEKVIKIKNGAVKTVVTENREYECKSVIVATGLTHRRLGAENEEKFIGAGVSFCAVCDGAFFKNADVAVVGGGNTALQDALYLSDICRRVYLVHRREGFRGEERLVTKIKNRENIELLLNKTVSEISGDTTVSSITLSDVSNGEKSQLDVSGVFVAVGQIPHNSDFADVINLDDGGYVLSDENCRTNEQGIFVAGDCRTKEVRQLTTAVADGASAAIAACEEL